MERKIEERKANTIKKSLRNINDIEEKEAKKSGFLSMNAEICMPNNNNATITSIKLSEDMGKYNSFVEQGNTTCRKN